MLGILEDHVSWAKVYKKMTDDLPIRLCLELINTPRLLRTMPFGKPLAEVPKSYYKFLNEQGAFDKPDNAELKQSLQKLNLI